MHLQKHIQNNLRFLLVEVAAQVSKLEAYFEQENPSLAQQIIDRSGYAYNLRQRIQNGCMQALAKGRQTDGVDTMMFRAVTAIATELDRIAELCRECIDQLGYLRDSHKLDLRAYIPLLKRVTKGIDLIEQALLGSDTKLALKLGKTESKLDRSYKKLVDKYTVQLGKQDRAEDLVTGLFVANIIGQMGDALLSISESIISSNLGQDLDTQRFQTLRDTIAGWLDDDAIEQLSIEQVAETRSGSGISAVQYADDDNGELQAIFKEGKRRKLKEEREGVERWHKVYPGVAPQILTYENQGDSAALLIEHLQGLTFEDIALNAGPKLRKNSMQALGRTLTDVWTATRKKESIPAGFVQQTRKRLADVYAVHPEFHQGEAGVCGITVLGFEQQLEQIAAIEARYPPPFVVFIHGDFNVDNILYDQHEDRIRFIDLHRSTHLDYVQDVSVFMVSNFRLQVLDRPVRLRIRRQVLDFFAIARDFARQHKDAGFDVRLALGLVRSFTTSTRFILDRTLSRRMILLARYLTDLLIRLDAADALADFRLPIKELFGD